MFNHPTEKDSWSSGMLVQFTEGPLRGTVGEVFMIRALDVLIRLEEGVYVRVPKHEGSNLVAVTE